MAALADEYLARGGTPTLCPPADGMADRFDPAQEGARENAPAPHGRAAALGRALPVFLAAALLGACAALALRAMRRG